MPEEEVARTGQRLQLRPVQDDAAAPDADKLQRETARVPERSKVEQKTRGFSLGHEWACRRVPLPDRLAGASTRRKNGDVLSVYEGDYLAWGRTKSCAGDLICCPLERLRLRLSDASIGRVSECFVKVIVCFIREAFVDW